MVQGVVSVELLADNGQLNINQELVKRGYAVPSEESYDSKVRAIEYDVVFMCEIHHTLHKMCKKWASPMFSYGII